MLAFIKWLPSASIFNQFKRIHCSVIWMVGPFGQKTSFCQFWSQLTCRHVHCSPIEGLCEGVPPKNPLSQSAMLAKDQVIGALPPRNILSRRAAFLSRFAGAFGHLERLQRAAGKPPSWIRKHLCLAWLGSTTTQSNLISNGSFFISLSGKCWF